MNLQARGAGNSRARRWTAQGHRGATVVTAVPRGATSLHKIRLRASNCFLLVGDGAVLVDTGLKGEGERIIRAMASAGVAARDLRLILLSHGHADHAGAAPEVSAATGAPIALRSEDASWTSQGLQVPAPPVTPWARVISRFLSAPFLREAMPTPMLVPDVLIQQAELGLAAYGVQGTVLHTPGHTAGSISVVLADGRAIVGDLAMNGLPSSPFRPTPPMVAQDADLLIASWKLIYDRGATYVYPGHGAPFAWADLEMRL